MTTVGSDCIYVRSLKTDTNNNNTNDNFAVEIPFECVRDRIEDVMNCLTSEIAPIEIWHRIAIELHRRGYDKECTQIITKAITDDMKNKKMKNESSTKSIHLYNAGPKARIHLFNAATIDLINQPSTNRNNARKTVKNAVKYANITGEIAHRENKAQQFNKLAILIQGLIGIEKAKTNRSDITSVINDTKDKLDKILNMNTNNDIQFGSSYTKFLIYYGKACFSYSTGDWEESLNTFEHILNDYPHTCPPYIHLGIGMCCLKLNEYEIARLSFERAKSLESNGYIGVRSRIGLALVYLNMHKYEEIDNELLIKQSYDQNNDINDQNKMQQKLQSLQKALRELTDASNIDPSNPQILVLLANFIGFSFMNNKLILKLVGAAFSYCQQMTHLPLMTDEMILHQINSGLQSSSKTVNMNMEHLSNCVLSNSRHPLAQCQSEACYVIGKMYHVLSDYKHAMIWYYKSLIISPYFILPLYGMAQMYVWMEEYHHARDCLERIRSGNGKNCCVLKLLAFVYTHISGKKSNALKLLKMAIKINPNDVQSHISLAELCEQTNILLAKQSYLKARTLLLKQKKQIPYELYNNIIVLMYKLKEYKNAKKFCEHLICQINKKSDPETFDFAQIIKTRVISANDCVIHFNYACILEKLGLYKYARKTYMNILKTNPEFVEAIIGCALYCYRINKIEDALRKLKSAVQMAHEQKCPSMECNALLIMTRILHRHAKRSDTQHIIDRLRIVVKNNTQLLARDEYITIFKANFLLSKPKNERTLAEVTQASKSFMHVLMGNEKNAYAAHGLGVIAADIGLLDIAKNIFNDIKDAVCMPDNSVHLGHIACAHKDWQIAIKYYTKAVRKLSPDEYGDIPLYIARALFAKGDFVQCKLELHKMIRGDPTQEIYLYNLALCEEEHAVSILSKTAKMRQLTEVEDAILMLENGRRLYQRLNDNKVQFRCIPNHKLLQHLKHIDLQVLPNARQHLEYHQKENEEKIKQFAKEEKKMEEYLKREEEKKRLEKEREKYDEQMRQQMAKNLKYTVQKLDPQPLKTVTNKEKSKSPELEMDDIFEEMEEEFNWNASAVEKNVTVDELFDENVAYVSPVKKRRLTVKKSDGTDFDDELQLQMNEKSKKKKKHKSKKSKKKRKKSSKKHKHKERHFDEKEWKILKLALADIIKDANMSVITNRMIKITLSEKYPSIKLRPYKIMIHDEIDSLAAVKMNI